MSNVEFQVRGYRVVDSSGLYVIATFKDCRSCFGVDIEKMSTVSKDPLVTVFTKPDVLSKPAALRLLAAWIDHGYVGKLVAVKKRVKLCRHCGKTL